MSNKVSFTSQPVNTAINGGGNNRFSGVGFGATGQGVNNQNPLLGFIPPTDARFATNNLHSPNFRVATGAESGSIASQNGVDFGPGFPKSFDGTPSMPPGFGENSPTLFMNA